MSEQNKALMRRAIEEVWNQGNYSALEVLVSSDFLIHGATPETDVVGREAAAQYFMMLRAAFPDLRFTVEDLIAEGDRVVTRWTASATHQGDFHGIPATGRQVSLSGTDVDRISGGMVVECWPSVDQFGLMQQLGALPEPAQVGS